MIGFFRSASSLSVLLLLFSMLLEAQPNALAQPLDQVDSAEQQKHAVNGASNAQSSSTDVLMPEGTPSLYDDSGSSPPKGKPDPSASVTVQKPRALTDENLNDSNAQREITKGFSTESQIFSNQDIGSSTQGSVNNSTNSEAPVPNLTNQSPKQPSPRGHLKENPAFNESDQPTSVPYSAQPVHQGPLTFPTLVPSGNTTRVTPGH